MKGSMEVNKNFAEEMEYLFRRERLLTFKMPIKSLGLLVDALKKYKSECTEAIATFSAILYRKRESKFNQSHSQSLEGVYYSMVNSGKDQAEVGRFKELFQKLRRAKSYSFKDRKVYGRKDQESQSDQQMIRSMQKNVRCAEEIMKKDFKSYAKLIRKLMMKSRLRMLRMPIENLSLLIQRLREDSDPLLDISEVKLAYKKEGLQLLSEEELQRNKAFLEEVYKENVETNPDKEHAEIWRMEFDKLDEMNYVDFRDGLYILGDVLRRFKVKKVIGARKLVFTSPTTGQLSVRIFVTRGARFLEENELIEFAKGQLSSEYQELLASIDLESSEELFLSGSPGKRYQYEVKVEFRCREGHLETYQKLTELFQTEENQQIEKNEEEQYLEDENLEQELESEDDKPSVPEVSND